MVMQRIANPPTPVRFRLRPPPSKAPQITVCGVFLWLRKRGDVFRIFGRLPHVGIEGGKPNGVGGYFWRRILNVSFYFASAKLLHRY